MTSFQLIVGDQEGAVNLISAKREANAIVLDTDFKLQAPSKVQSIQLSGLPNTLPDKIFVCLENRVMAYTKKGKLFLSFDTNLTETINVMVVHGPDLMICGNHVYNHYKDCKDVGSYLCGDVIVDMVALFPNNVQSWSFLTQDRLLTFPSPLLDEPHCNCPCLFRSGASPSGTLQGASDY